MNFGLVNGVIVLYLIPLDYVILPKHLHSVDFSSDLLSHQEHLKYSILQYTYADSAQPKELKNSNTKNSTVVLIP